MAADFSWVPETLTKLLERSESHYRSVGFKRTAYLMKSTSEDAKNNNVSVDFYGKYVRLLKDDASEFVGNMGFDAETKGAFVSSLHRSVDAVHVLLDTMDKDGKTPTFNGATSRKEDVEAVNVYLDAAGGIIDPVESTGNPYSALESADPFYETVYNHVYLPGKEFLVAQAGIPLGREHMMEYADAILSVDGLIPDKGENASDFRYAFQHPGKFTEDMKGWILTDRVTVPVKSIARWPILMYYKVPIVTAMLPVHNVVFFALVNETVRKKSR